MTRCLPASWELEPAARRFVRWLDALLVCRTRTRSANGSMNPSVGFPTLNVRPRRAPAAPARPPPPPAAPVPPPPPGAAPPRRVGGAPPAVPPRPGAGGGGDLPPAGERHRHRRGRQHRGNRRLWQVRQPPDLGF